MDKYSLDLMNGVFYDLEDLIVYLSDRWADERKFEDIADYQAVIEKRLPAGIVITKMLKRPFGFTWQIGDFEGNLKITAGGRYSWSRTK